MVDYQKKNLNDSKRLLKKRSKTKSKQNTGSTFPKWKNVLPAKGMSLDADLAMFLCR